MQTSLEIENANTQIGIALAELVASSRVALAKVNGIPLSMRVETYWQPKGQGYWSKGQTTTLEDGIVWDCEWVEAVIGGETYMQFDHRYDGSNNPGILLVIANVIGC